MELPGDPAIPLWVTCPRENRSIQKPVHKCSQCTVKGRNSPNVHPLINKMCFIHIVEYYSAIKRAAVLIHATVWVNLENMQNDRSQAQMIHTVRLHFYKTLKTYIHRQETCGCQGWGREGTTKKEGVSFGQWQECSRLDSGDSCTTL